MQKTNRSRPRLTERAIRIAVRGLVSLGQILVLLLLVVHVHLVAASENALNAQGGLDDLIRQSNFIFRGTVIKVGAASMPQVPVTDAVVVVRVDEILRTAANLGDLAGREITVQLKAPRSVKEGQKVVFFTRPWLYGQGIAVVEVGRGEAGEGTAELQKRIVEAARTEADINLRKRIAQAEILIVGKVSETKPAKGENPPPKVSEHDPEWWRATISIESVEKGKFPEKTVEVIFPSSTDEMWEAAPKFRVNQEGIWILQKDQKEKGWPIFRLSGYTALDPLDFQDREHLERVRELIRELR